MIISFLLNGDDFNNPTNQRHIDIQKDLTIRLEEILKPISQNLLTESGTFIFNYDNNGKLIQLSWSGFSPDISGQIFSTLKNVDFTNK